jgi:hypothetical protein
MLLPVPRGRQQERSGCRGCDKRQGRRQGVGAGGDDVAGAYDGEGETRNIYFLSLQSIDIIV